jgi:hypothetical protein
MRIPVEQVLNIPRVPEYGSYHSHSPLLDRRVENQRERAGESKNVCGRKRKREKERERDREVEREIESERGRERKR